MMNEQQNDTTNEISLLDIFKILMSNLHLILIFTFIIAGLVTVYAYAIATPQYESNADVMVQVQTDQVIVGSYDYTTAQKLLSTIAELMKKDIVLDKVISELSLDMTANQLRSGLTVSSSTTSYFINITYLSPDNTSSKNIVNYIIDSAIDVTNNNPSFSSLKDKISRTSNAELGTYASPNRPLYIIIGVILGGIVGIGFAFLKEMLNNTFKTKEQLEAAFDIQVLGIIPEFVVKEDKV